jgi:hypothetical protein
MTHMEKGAADFRFAFAIQGLCGAIALILAIAG